MKRKGIWLAVSAALLASLSGCVQEEEQNESVSDTAAPQQFQTAARRAQDDFYGYINEQSLLNAQLSPADLSAGSAEDMEAQVNEEVFEMIVNIAKSDEEYAPGSNEQLVRDVFNQYAAYVSNRTSSAKTEFERLAGQIETIDSVEGIENMISDLQEAGIVSYFDVACDQNFYDGQSYSLYLNQKTDFAGVAIEDFYEQESSKKSLRTFAVNVLIAAGDDTETAKAKADDLVYFLLDIASETDYDVLHAANPYTTFTFYTDEEMDEKFGKGSAELIETIYGIDNPYGGWMVQDDGQLQMLLSKFSEENVEVLKSWLLCDVACSWKDFLQEDYAFLRASGVDYNQANEPMAASMMSSLLGSQISELYAKTYYTEEMDAAVHQMYEDIADGYRKLISEADWLSEATRNSLLKKLDNMVFVAGAGIEHEVSADDANLIGKDAFETYVNLSANEIVQERSHIGQTLDKAAAGLNSQVLNARYNPSNTFTVSVAMMHAPYFDVSQSDAANLGGLGMVMAHEMGHAFDSNCLVYDENGAYRPDWICQEDQDKMADKVAQMEDYYSSFTVMDIYHVDGVKTAAENFADKGAMECLMKVVTNPDEQKALFDNYGRIWNELVEDDYVIDLIAANEHSPNEVRVNGVLSSTDEFYDVYGVVEGDGMYKRPEERVSRWYERG